ncbi:MAG: hypothetical protein HY554_19225, partial [Elusimicrobia bacterium]|nr:hypothetical protein [Elusimicrobiota bacterium]
GGGAPTGIAIVNVINSLLSKTGRVALDPRTNTVIVTDIPETFPQVEQIIAELDKKVPQVMIESQIVEINSSRSQELGFTWGDDKGELVSFKGGNRNTAFPFNLGENVGKLQFFGYNGAWQTDGSGGNLSFTKLAVVLKAIVTRGEGRFLGKPKILTLNNKKARIEITKKEAIEILAPVAVAGGIAGGLGQPTVTREDTGVLLEVTPQVNKDGYITLLVEPSVTDAIPSTIAPTTVKDTVKRKASSLLRLKNGQTVVMGGLLSSREDKTTSKVPFLGYIPLIGWLFTNTKVERRNTDLVIFLTPSVVND